MKRKEKVESRLKRKKRIRKNIFGTMDKPRLCVYKSLKAMYAQLIDDAKGVTLAAASTVDKEIKGKAKAGIEAAKSVGTLIAKRGKEAKVSKVVFDRSGYLFHGRVKALADAAREHGLEF